MGQPLDRQSPFYVGFVGALGALIAIGLWSMLGRLTVTLTVLVVAAFLTLALNPLVELLTDREVRRPVAVAIVFGALLILLALVGRLVFPPVVVQGSELLNTAPSYFTDLLRTPWIQQLDADYDVISRAQSELEDRIADGSLVGQIFGGVLGAGKAVATGLFQTLTILILTLYFMASLPRMKQTAFALVPASRRPRVEPLAEEIMRRTGAYAIGQFAVAGVNAVLSWVVLLIVGVPYPAVLAVVVGLLGLIPMVGATLGAVIVVTVAFFDEPQKAVIMAIYYVIYQQVENYVVVPRIMQRTVSVPGAVTVVAALAGGTLLGVLGALIAIPLAAGLLLIFEEVIVPRQAHH